MSYCLDPFTAAIIKKKRANYIIFKFDKLEYLKEKVLGKENTHFVV